MLQCEEDIFYTSARKYFDVFDVVVRGGAGVSNSSVRGNGGVPVLHCRGEFFEMMGFRCFSQRE
jgi:hypothetical protein